MRSGCRRLAASFLVVATGASLGVGAKGASIIAPWSGASASAEFNAASDAQQWATASACAGGSNSILTQAGGAGSTSSATFDSGLASPNAVPKPAGFTPCEGEAPGGLGAWARKKGFVK